MDAKTVLAESRRYLLAVAAIVALGVVLLPARGLAPSTTFMLLFVPAVVAVARLTDVRVSAVAAVAAFLTLDFLFVPPYYTFTVSTLAEWVALAVFLGVALTTARQTDRLRQRQEAAVARRRELELLNRASFRAVSEDSPEALAAFVVGQVRDVLDAARAALYTGCGSSPLLLAGDGPPECEPDESDLVTWVLREGKAIGLPPEAVPLDQRPVAVAAAVAVPGSTARGAYLPLQTTEVLEGVLVAVPSHPGAVTPAEARILAALANLSAACLERLRLEDVASHAKAVTEAERLKSTLVASVSHELKTPLAAATARVTGLLQGRTAADEGRVRTQLAAVVQDLGRLDASIRDLLDVSRLESASWEQRLEPFDVREILGTVLAREPADLRDHVRFEAADIVPEVLVDGAQLARALANLIENAFAYTPPDTPITVTLAETPGGEVEIAVEDRGPGVPDTEKPHVFEKFFRGSSAARAPHGSGLGLTIAAEIVRIHGGTMRVEDAKPQGARFVIVLPAAEETQK
ncbi:MAG TPA: ATP-binding protein [Coriobacteriia bacterium]|jgi:two-component system sensor histidine kinase KdpD